MIYTPQPQEVDLLSLYNVTIRAVSDMDSLSQETEEGNRKASGRIRMKDHDLGLEV